MIKKSKTKDLAWLEKEVQKDQLLVETHKKKMIQELLKTKKEDLFIPPTIKKKSKLKHNKTGEIFLTLANVKPDE